MKLQALFLICVGMVVACGPVDSGLKDDTTSNIIHMTNVDMNAIQAKLSESQYKGKKAIVTIGASNFHCPFCVDLNTVANSFAAKNPDVVIVQIKNQENSSIINFMRTQAQGSAMVVEGQAVTPSYVGIPLAFALDVAEAGNARKLSKNGGNASILSPFVGATQGSSLQVLQAKLYNFKGNAESTLIYSVMHDWVGKSSGTSAQIAQAPVNTHQKATVHSAGNGQVTFNVCAGSGCSIPKTVALATFQQETAGMSIGFASDTARTQAEQMGILSTGY